MSTMADEIKTYIDERDRAVEDRIKAWLIRTVLVQFVGLAIFLGPIIFYIGGIYRDVQTMAATQVAQNGELAQRGLWMQQREQWEITMETWAMARGFVPPRYRRGAEGVADQ